jgi:hypothetical protein
MNGVVTTAAWAAAAVNLLVGAFGALRWWLVAPTPWFWPLLRGAQIVSVVFAVLCGVIALAGHRPDDGLFWLYVLLPPAVAFVAEQLRIASADSVLDARDLPDAQAVGALPEAEQRSVVLAILRREMGVMSASCIVVAFLLVRAATTATGF